MIIKAKHHFIINPFFTWHANYIVSKRFGVKKIIGNVVEKGLPVLIVANHQSWWDGHWVEYINQRIFKRKFHFMMREDQLRKNWFLNYAGGYSVDKNSRSIVESLNYSSELLQNPNNLVLIFPQGEIQSIHQREIIFQKGIERVLKNTSNPIQILFLVSLVDYFSDQKPGVYFHLREYTSDAFDIQSLQQSYRQFYIAAIEKQKTLTNEA